MRAAESTPQTLLVALGVVLFCSVMVSTTVELLRPVQLAYKQIDRNRVVVKVTGLASAGEELSDREIVDRFRELEVRAVDLADGRFTNAVDPLTYDQRAAVEHPELSVAIESSKDIAGLGRRARYALVYVLSDGQSVRRITLPVHGRGMWSTIYGYITLDGDMTTVTDIMFFEHGETPGIGDQIESPAWRASWLGKLIYDDNGKPAIAAAPAPAAGPAERHRVDAIAGATLTVNGAMNAVLYWLGEDGFGPFLKQLRSTHAQAAHLSRE